MFEVSLIKLPSRNCLQINVTGTLLKINPTLVQVHLMTWCLYFNVVWSDSSCRPVGDQSAISRRSVGERSATGWRLYLERLFLIAETLQLFGDRSATNRRLVGDQSATKNCVGIVCNHCNWSAISRQPVGDLSATCRRPPKTFLRSIWSQRGFTCSNQNLLATKSSLQPSATGRRPVADLLATTLQPPCDQPKFWSQRGRRPVASYVWPGLNAGVGVLFNVRINKRSSKHSRVQVIWDAMVVIVTSLWCVFRHLLVDRKCLQFWFIFHCRHSYLLAIFVKCDHKIC